MLCFCRDNSGPAYYTDLKVVDSNAIFFESLLFGHIWRSRFGFRKKYFLMNEIETSVFVLERSSQQEIFIILLNDSLVNKQN